MRKSFPGAPTLLDEVTGEDGHWDAGNSPYGCFAGFFMAFLYVTITFSLLRVQEALEVRSPPFLPGAHRRADGIK